MVTLNHWQGSQDLCLALPFLGAQVEKDESTRDDPSPQFWFHLRSALGADGILGCNPLVAPSHRPRFLSQYNAGV